MPQQCRWLGALIGMSLGTAVAAAQPPLPAVLPPVGDPPAVQDLPVTIVVPPPKPLPDADAPDQSLPPTDQPARSDGGLGGSLRSSAEYLLWWMKGAPLPPLATRNATGVSPALSDPNTRVLIGDSADLGERSGGRFVLTQTFNDSGTLGLEGGYFFLGTRTTSLSAIGGSAPGGASVGRPYVDAATGQETAAIIGSPAFMSGTFTAASSARAQGAELNFVTDLLGGDHWQIDGLVGYRFLQIYEGLSLEQQGLMFGPGSFATPTAFGRQDQFDAHNLYNGGQIGLRADLHKGPVFVEVTGKVAFGVNSEMVRVGGITAVQAPGQPSASLPGGLLALPTNSGRVTRSAFAVVPEAIVRVGFNINNSSRFFVGYNFLELSDAVRPGDQIDRTVNTSLVPFNSRFTPPAGEPDRPQLVLRSSDVWLQGLIVGFEGEW